VRVTVTRTTHDSRRLGQRLLAIVDDAEGIVGDGAGTGLSIAPAIMRDEGGLHAEVVFPA
jgi:hypothetical protein